MDQFNKYLYLGIFIYFLPTIIFILRIRSRERIRSDMGSLGLKNILGYGFVNLILAWTIMGWFSLMLDSTFPGLFYNAEKDSADSNDEEEEKDYEIKNSSNIEMGYVRQGKWLTPYVDKIIHWDRHL